VIKSILEVDYRSDQLPERCWSSGDHSCSSPRILQPHKHAINFVTGSKNPLNNQRNACLTPTRQHSNKQPTYSLSADHSCRLSFIGHLYCADPWQDHHRALQACIAGPPLETEDWSSKATLAQNCGGRPATYESWTGDCQAVRSGPIGLAETRGNGYFVSDTLMKKKYSLNRELEEYYTS